MAPELFMPFLFAAIVCFAWVIGTYNRFVKYRNRIEEAWSSIDVSLKRRANLIPSLIKVIEGYGTHESDIFERKTAVSEKLGSSRIREEHKITESLGGLLALAEAYPDLKASSNFLALQQSLDTVEQDIQKARNRYNGFISRYNTLVESFPAGILARKFAFEKKDYLNLELATQREMPSVDFAKKG